MGNDQAVWLAVGGLALLCLLLLVVVLRQRASAAASRSEADALRDRLERLETRLDASASTPAAAPTPAAPVEFVITDLGTRVESEQEPEPVSAPTFADIVLKETVVMAASLAHGVRRGLAPAQRNRIRFEMKQEVRRSRKQRRSDLKAAQRDLHARQRAAMSPEAEAAS